MSSEPRRKLLKTIAAGSGAIVAGTGGLGSAGGTFCTNGTDGQVTISY